MNIVAPVSSVNEVPMLLQCGADELYCGINPVAWEEKFGERCWINRRDPSHSGIGSVKELQQIVAMAGEKKVPVYITLNSHFYPSSGIDFLVEMAKYLTTTIGAGGVIVSDTNLLLKLSKKAPLVRVHLSSLGSCFNSWSVDFYRSLGVKRIILPRQLLLSEIGQLVIRAGSDMEFEVFGVNDGCVFEEGYCQTFHGLSPFCLTDWHSAPMARINSTENAHLFTNGQNALQNPNGKKKQPDMNGQQKEQLNTIVQEEQMEAFRDYRWFQNNCGSSFQADGLPNGPCSLCRFGDFKKWGITAVKIVGREASFHRKMGSIQLVKAVMDAVREGAENKEIAELARSIRNTPEYCDSGRMCYFNDPQEIAI